MRLREGRENEKRERGVGVLGERERELRYGLEYGGKCCV